MLIVLSVPEVLRRAAVLHIESRRATDILAPRTTKRSRPLRRAAGSPSRTIRRALLLRRIVADFVEKIGVVGQHSGCGYRQVATQE